MSRNFFLTKLGTCIDIKEIWFGIANGQISSIFDRDISQQRDNDGLLLFYVFILYNLEVLFIFFI